MDVYADGACLGNPGPGGYGSVLLFSDGSGRVYRKELSGGFAGTTNNRMEIVSVVAALDALREPCGVTVYSDSRYVVDSVEKGWLERWAKNGWAKSDKEPVLNRDLWQKLIPLIKKHDVEFVWIKGHGGNAENERCDFLARKAAASVESGDGG
ncbi:MAG: ribonuclease HI [Defluviitaleaceae bacterium]|nr:ribonuclease HI [Defluviitaleaceae bacterium]